MAPAINPSSTGTSTVFPSGLTARETTVLTCRRFSTPRACRMAGAPTPE
jgi:hypothetical protein